MDWFRPKLDELVTAITKLRRVIAAYEADQKEREAIAVREYSAALVAGKPTDKEALAKVFSTSVESVEGVSKRTVWKFRITDEAAVPREFLLVDEKRIGQIVRAMKGETKIPGIEAYPETVLAVSTEGEDQ
jgi:hypothetical protein